MRETLGLCEQLIVLEPNKRSDIAGLLLVSNDAMRVKWALSCKRSLNKQKHRLRAQITDSNSSGQAALLRALKDGQTCVCDGSRRALAKL